MKQLAVLCAAVFLALSGRAEAARLVVTIEGIRSAEGRVYCALFNRPEGFPDGDYSYRHVIVKAAIHPLTVNFDDLSPGRYAVGCYHDENWNGRLDTTFIGYPDEGYALSNGVRATFSRPTFAEAAFWLNGGAGHVVLHGEY